MRDLPSPNIARQEFMKWKSEYPALAIRSHQHPVDEFVSGCACRIKLIDSDHYCSLLFLIVSAKTYIFTTENVLRYDNIVDDISYYFDELLISSDSNCVYVLI